MDKNERLRYNVEETYQFIVEPGADSELSALESDCDGEDLEVLGESVEDQLFSIDDSLIEEGDITESNKENEKPNSEINQKSSNKKQEHVFKWQKRKIGEVDTTFKGEQFPPPPEGADVMTPLQYFKLFWNDELTSLISEQTNLYSVQKSDKSIATSKDEIEMFLGMQMYMSIVRLPSYVMYWSTETRYAPVADVMPIGRYKKLRQYLHVNDNTLAGSEENKNNRLYKIQPVLEHVRNNCQKIVPEVENSIDEQIIPAKTRYSGIRQYNPKKPVKWGFKNFVRAGKSGMMYDFFLYAGANTSSEKCTGEYVVFRLCETLPKHKNYQLYFDNWFSTLALCIKMKELGILTTATVRSDRLKKCPLPTDKELMKKGRGSSEFRCDANSGVTVLKWFDNKCVQVCSTYSCPATNSTVKRWNRDQRKYVEIKCPTTIKEYNQSMGGVDLADMLISLYRTSIKTRRWYLKVLFHCLDIAKVNAWLLYRRYSEQMNVPDKHQLSLLKFTIRIAEGLLRGGKVPNSVGRPRKRKATDTPSPTSRKQAAAVPCEDVRCDNVAHWPEFRKKKNKCRLCKTNYSRAYCKKCNLCLCLNNTRNCFYGFHTK